MQVRTSAIWGILAAALPPAIVAAFQMPGMGGSLSGLLEGLFEFATLAGSAHLLSLGSIAVIALPALLLLLRFGASLQWASAVAALAAGLLFPLSSGWSLGQLREDSLPWLLAAVLAAASYSIAAAKRTLQVPMNSP
jgi:hypothetical protein